MAGAAPDSEFVAFLLDQLRRRQPATARRMFSGQGLFRGAVMFGLVIGDTPYFRTDDRNRAAYEAAGMPPFTYQRAGRAVALGYHAVPPDILEDADALADWADEAYAAALRRAPRARARRRRNKSGMREAP